MKKNLSQLKRQRQNEKLRERNRGLRSTMRTSIRRARVAIEQDPGSDQTKTIVGEATRTIDRMVTKGLLHRSTAARYKSRLVGHHNKSAKGSAAETAAVAEEPVESAGEETTESA